MNYLTFLVLWMIILPGIAISQPRIYPAPAGLKSSSEYQVKVDGKDAFVYASPVPAAYCSFDMNRPVTVTIRASRDIKWVDVRPSSAGIHPVFKDSLITLRIDRPVQLSIELNGSTRMPLFLFANAYEKDRPAPGDPNTLFFAAGKVYYPGIIEAKSNETIYIEGGAVVVGVIHAKNAKHIRVCGRGVLDGTYNKHFNGGTYERFLEFRDCEDLRIEDITLHNSTSWQIVPLHCNRVRIRNVRIVSDQGSDDGIDIVRSRNVSITDCFIRTKDDCIAIKSNFDYPGPEGVDSIRVQHCTFWNGDWGNGLEIGFELNSDKVTNIVFRDNDLIHVRDGAAISIHNAGKAEVSNVLFDNIRIEDANQKLFDLAIFRSRYSEDSGRNDDEYRRLYLNGAWDGVLATPGEEKKTHAAYRGHIRDITFRNIRILDGNFPYSIFYGYDSAHKVEHIKIENLVVHGQRITSLRQAKIYQENTSGITIR